MNSLKTKLISVIFLLLLCIPKKGISQGMRMWNSGVYYVIDYRVFFCAQYTLSYPHTKKHSRRVKFKERETCSCINSNYYLLKGEMRAYSGTVHVGGYNTVIIWDTSFIRNHILPTFSVKKDRQRIINTLNHSNDSTFKNVIDYENKVVLNDKMYYYPLKFRAGYVFNNISYEWLKSIVPESSWIYDPNCFDMGDGMSISLIIPMLDKIK